MKYLTIHKRDYILYCYLVIACDGVIQAGRDGLTKKFREYALRPFALPQLALFVALLILPR